MFAQNTKSAENLYFNKMRKEDWCISTVLTAVSYSQCRPVDIYINFVDQLDRKAKSKHVTGSK